MRRENVYSVPTVGTVSQGRRCGCAVGLLSDVVSNLPQRMHAGTCGNPWIVIPCARHSDEEGPQGTGGA
jgi:hypothetical protein